MTTAETTKFCASQIECILRYVQNVYSDEHDLENNLSMAIVRLEELAK